MKKAQAAMEYVSTYVYAGLALVVVVGAMGYFGAFDSSTYTKESCESGAQISCADAQITTEGMMGVMLANNHNRNITITNYTIYYNGEAYPVDNANIIIQPNNNGSITLETSGIAFNKGKKESFTYTINYIPGGSTRSVQLSGTATTRVEEDILPVCGNNLLESGRGEECDKGPNGGWIPENEYSCKEYLLEREYDTHTLSEYDVKGQLWCDKHCKIQPNNQELGCRMVSKTADCQGCYDTQGACISVGHTGNSGQYSDSVDYCQSQEIWQDCNETMSDTCSQGMTCKYGYCITVHTCGNGKLDTGEQCDYNISGSLLGVCEAGACNPDCTCPNITICDYCAYDNECYDDMTNLTIKGDEKTCAYDQTGGRWSWFSSSNIDLHDGINCSTYAYKEMGWMGDYNGTCCDYGLSIKTYDMNSTTYSVCCDAFTDCAFNNMCYDDKQQHPFKTKITCMEGWWSNENPMLI